MKGTVQSPPSFTTAVVFRSSSALGKNFWLGGGSRSPKARSPQPGVDPPLHRDQTCQDAYGGRPDDAIALAMRYVIIISALAFFLIWDGLYNQGRYLDTTVRQVSHAVRYVTAKF